MDSKIVAREYITTNRCERLDPVYWQAFNITTDRVLYDGATEWIEETVEAMSIDTNPVQAMQTAMGSTLSYMYQNVYEKGFDGLVEYKAYERNLEAKREEVNDDSKTESIQTS